MLNRPVGTGCGFFPGATCFGGRGGLGLAVAEESAAPGLVGAPVPGAACGSAWVTAGGGLATEESMTTIFPAPPFFTGKWVVADGKRPVVPLDGKGG